MKTSNKKYPKRINDFPPQKAPDMAEIQTETIVQKQPAVAEGDDEKPIADIDIPDSEEDNMTTIDEEFDTQEIAAALKQHEELTAGE